MNTRESVLGRTRALALPLLACLSLVLTADNALADPIPAGALPPGVTIQDLGGGNWLIVGPDGSIVDFISFDIFDNEHVTFQLGSTSARFLNRVIGDFDGTQINGRLTADGIVYFVNPAGVFFGNGAVVNVGGIYAAAATISDADFTRGKDRFTDVGGEVVNQGAITAAGSVHLIAERVANHGAIVAGEAVTMLAAGDEVLITPIGGGRVSVRIDGVRLTSTLSSPDSVVDLSGDAGVTNTGSVTSGTSLILGAGDMYGLAIRNSGSLEGEAVHLSALGGTVAHEGSIEAKNLVMTGGAIYLASDIEADKAMFNDAVYIGADMEMRGLSGAARFFKFWSTIDDYVTGDGTGDHTLTLRSNRVDVDGSVGAGDRLGYLDVHGTAKFGGDVLTEDGIRFRSDVELDGNNINQRVDAGAGVLDADADILKATAGHMTLAGDDGIRVGGDLLQTDTVAGGDIRILNDLRLDGVNINQRIDTELGTIDATGDIVKTTAGHLTLEASNGIELAGDLRHTDTLAGGDIRILSDLTLDGVNINQRIDADNGRIDAAHDIVKTTAGHLTLEASNGIELAGDLLMTDDLVGGDMRILSDLTLDGINVNQRVDAGMGTLDAESDIVKTTAGHLTLAGQGGIELGGDLRQTDHLLGGDIDILNDLTLDGAGAQRIDAELGSVDAAGDVVKTTTGRLTLAGGQGIAIEGDLLHVGQGGQGDGGGEIAIVVEDALTLDGTGTQRIDAGVGRVEFQSTVAKTTGGTLNIGGDDGVSIADDVRAHAGNLNIEDAVELTGDAELRASGRLVIARTIDGAHELVLVSGGHMYLRGAVGGGTALRSIDIRVSDGGVLHLDGGLLRANGDILLNDGITLAAVPVAATIAADGDLRIESIGGDVRMGALQKLTVLGTLEIDGADVVVLGDVNTLGDMIVDATTIYLLTREAGEVLLADGSFVMDSGLDLVAGGTFRFSVAPELMGDRGVIFMGEDGNGTLGAFQVEALRSALDLVDDSGVVLDAFVLIGDSSVGATESAANLGEALPEFVDAERHRVPIRDARSLALMRELAQRFGIETRSLRQPELAAATTHRAVVEDNPQTVVDPAGVRTTIAYDRLENVSVAAAVHAFEELVGSDGAAAGTVRERLSSGWTAYRTALRVPDPDPAGFTDWLMANDRSAAVEDLRKLGAVLAALRSIGATSGEIAGAEARVLDSVASPTVPADILRLIVE